MVSSNTGGELDFMENSKYIPYIFFLETMVYAQNALVWSKHDMHNSMHDMHHDAQVHK